MERIGKKGFVPNIPLTLGHFCDIPLSRLVLVHPVFASRGSGVRTPSRPPSICLQIRLLLMRPWPDLPKIGLVREVAHLNPTGRSAQAGSSFPSAASIFSGVMGKSRTRTPMAL